MASFLVSMVGSSGVSSELPFCILSLAGVPVIWSWFLLVLSLVSSFMAWSLAQALQLWFGILCELYLSVVYLWSGVLYKMWFCLYFRGPIGVIIGNSVFTPNAHLVTTRMHASAAAS